MSLERKVMTGLAVAALLLVVLLLSLAHGADAPAKIEAGRTIQTVSYVLKTTFSPTFNITPIAGGCGPRDYISLYVSASPTAARLEMYGAQDETGAWFYLDNTKIVNDARNMCGGAVTFRGIATAPVGVTYEARLYRWMPGNTPHQVISRLAFTGPPAKVERRTYISEKAVFTRIPVGDLDEITVRRGDGGDEEKILMERGVTFSITNVLQGLDKPAATSAKEP